MLSYLSRFILISILCTACSSNGDPELTQARDVRQPAVAGRFYTSDPGKLRLAIEEFLKDAKEATVQEPIAIVVPHAGYVYSGQIAADAFNCVKEGNYDLVVILGTNHTKPGFDGVSIYPKGAYKTPLGLIQIDRKVAQKLIESDNRFTYNRSVHTHEHSVEVEIPFVQVLFPDAKIVTAVIGCPDLDLCITFGQALADVIRDRKALIVASSDFSHYPNYEDAKISDHAVLEAITTLDLDNVKDTIKEMRKRRISNLSTCACGEGPVLAAISAAKELGAKRGVVVSYANSGDALVGDKNRVVGYGAVALDTGDGSSDTKVLEEAAGSEYERPIPVKYRKVLLDLARETINRYLTTETMPLLRGYSSYVTFPSGAFVTLNKHGRLRGCIGHMIDDTPLNRTVGLMAMQAAFHDRRFQPVTLDELDDIEIEISVLTPYELIDEPDDIVLGRDGIVLRKNGRSSVYLPQVAPEQGWTLEETLNHLSMKAGLPQDAWRSGAQLLTFQAEVFSEEDR